MIGIAPMDNATPEDHVAQMAVTPRLTSDEPTLDQRFVKPAVQQLMRSERTNDGSIRQLLPETAAARSFVLSPPGSTGFAGGPRRPPSRRDRSVPAAAGLSGWLPHVVHRLLKLAGIVAGVSPAIFCAWCANQSGRWDLFERAGSIATTIGLIFATGRYIRHSTLELVMSRSRTHYPPDLVESLDEVIGARVGLALSGFGTLVWGWGAYLRWWSFGYLAVWGLLAAYRLRQNYHSA